MSVSLPPPTVPIESDAAEIRAQPPVRSLKFEQYTLELHGADVVSDALYDGIVEVSTSLSDVVRRLSAACYAAGYPACQTRYARVDNTVYVLLDTRGVDRVMGAPHIAKYFRGLEGDDSLTVYSLEPRRFLATMHADRAGTVAQPVIKDGDDGDTVMDIASVESEVASKLSAEFGNPGTRFVGRYLGSFNAGIGSVWGDEISLGWREGFTQIGSNANDGDYHELNLAVSRVTPWGIFGGGARKVDYDFSFQGFRIDADIRVYDVRWLYPWLASYRQRLITEIKFDRNDSTTQTVQGTRGELLDERYNSAELRLLYSRNDAVFGRALQTDASLSYRQGLKDQVAAPTNAELDYTYLRPVATLKYPIFADWQLATTFAAQFSDDRMPQQQQWVLGGFNNLTAFLPGSAAGDEGALGRIELSAPPLKRLGMRFTPTLLLEGGTARSNEGFNEVRLADVGLRLDVTFGEYVDLSMAYAEDLVSDNLRLDETARDDLTADLYFKLRMQF